MNTNAEERQPEPLPLAAILVLFGLLGVTLAILLASSADAVRVSPQNLPVTELPTTAVAAEPTAPPESPMPEEHDMAAMPAAEPPSEANRLETPAELYAWACAACHGPSGDGVEGFGSALAGSELLQDENVTEFVAFLTEPGPPVDPRVEFTHPVTVPELTEEQAVSLFHYIHTLIDQHE